MCVTKKCFSHLLVNYVLLPHARSTKSGSKVCKDPFEVETTKKKKRKKAKTSYAFLLIQFI